jgi:hypothetical protein
VSLRSYAKMRFTMARRVQYTLARHRGARPSTKPYSNPSWPSFLSHCTPSNRGHDKRHGCRHCSAPEMPTVLVLALSWMQSVAYLSLLAHDGKVPDHVQSHCKSVRLAQTLWYHNGDIDWTDFLIMLLLRVPVKVPAQSSPPSQPGVGSTKLRIPRSRAPRCHQLSSLVSTM